MKAHEPVIPGDIPDEQMPSLLRNWFLGSRAKRHLSRRRFLTVTGMLPAAGEGGTALDIGCGWGYNLFLLRGANYRAVGMDIVQNDFPAALRIAEANGYEAELVGGDMGSLPFRSESIDAVTAVETIEHVFHPDRQRAVMEVARVLRPGGVFAFSTPNYSSLVETGKRVAVRFPRLRKLLPPMCYPVGDIARSDYHPYSYHRPSKASELRLLLETAGMEMLEARRMIFIWKSLPDILFKPARLLEAVFERLPLFDRLGSTLVVHARKPVGESGEPPRRR